MQQIIHYFFHLVFPAIIAYVFYRKNWLKTYGILLATMLIDLDHLLANPVFLACRCSINFHPLHTYIAAFFYMVFLYWPKTRILAMGLLMHLATDQLDCWMSSFNC